MKAFMNISIVRSGCEIASYTINSMASDVFLPEMVLASVGMLDGYGFNEDQCDIERLALRKEIKRFKDQVSYQERNYPEDTVEIMVSYDFKYLHDMWVSFKAVKGAK